MTTKMNPILEELWRTKDDLAREADGDVRCLCENTRRWAAAYPHRNPVVSDGTELRTWLTRQKDVDLLVVREEARPYGSPEP